MKRPPIWLLALALVASGAGAAAGTTLAGHVTGEIPVTVSQAIVLGAMPQLQGKIDGGIATISDDNTAFTAAAELNNGDSFEVKLAVNNLSNDNLVALLTLKHTPPILLDVESISQNAENVTRIALDQWKFILKAHEDTIKDLEITVALPDDASPGFYKIDGKIEAVNF